MKTDFLVIHNDDLGNVIGQFYKTNIRTWNPSRSEARENKDMRLRVAYSRLAEESNEVSA